MRARNLRARYLIVGGGLAADAAAKAIRRADPSGRLLLVTDEEEGPYRRPALSKSPWRDAAGERLDLKTRAAVSCLLTNRTAVSIDPTERTVTLAEGESIGYERLLLATGARPKQLPQLAAGPRIIYYRKLSDYRRARDLAAEGSAAAVIGGGFVGSEMAAALTLAGVRVTMIFPEQGILGERLPPDLAARVTRDFESRGVSVLAGRTVRQATESARGVELTLDDDHSLEVDFVLVGAGVAPNDGLAESAGLLVRNGIVVDERLRAIDAASGHATEAIFAAGDVANFSWQAIDYTGRFEHEDNAYAMGAAAGRAMVASLQAQPTTERELPVFDHLPFFYSQVFGNGYEAVGLLDANLTTWAEFRTEGEGVVYYLEGDRLRGVLLFNTWGEVDAARDLLLSGEPVNPTNLKGRLPTYDDDH